MLNEKGNVELQAKIKFARHNGAQGPVSRKPRKLQRPEAFRGPGLSRNEPQAPVKIVLLSDFHGEFREVRVTMQESNKEEDSYYLLYIITNMRIIIPLS